MDYPESGCGAKAHPWWDETVFSNQTGQQSSPATAHQQHHSAARSTAAVSTVTPPSPCQLQPHHRHQQQQQQHQNVRYNRDRSVTSSRIASPGSVSMATATFGHAAAAAVEAASTAGNNVAKQATAAGASSSEADWLNQQLSEMQRFRQAHQAPANCGAEFHEENTTETNVNNDDRQRDEGLDDNGSNVRSGRRYASTETAAAAAAAAASSPCRHRRRHHRRRHHRRHWHRRPSSFSSYTSSTSSSETGTSSESSTHSSNSSGAASVMSPPASFVGHQIATNAAAAAASAASSRSGNTAAAPKPFTSLEQPPDAGDSIEAVYANFLNISQRLSTLISEYYSTAAANNASRTERQKQQQQQNQQQEQQQPQPPSRQLSQVTCRSAAIYHGDSGGERSPNQALILPSPLRRSMSSRRREQLSQRQQPEQKKKSAEAQLPPPRPLPPLPQEQQRCQSKSRKDQKEKTKSRHRHHSKKKSESGAGRSCSNSKGGLGLGSRIRASLSKKFSPRQRSNQQDEASSEEQPQQPLQPPPPPQPPSSHQDLHQASHALSINRQHQAIIDDLTAKESAELAAAAAAVSADSRVPLVGASDRQSMEPNLAKLQRLRATIVDLVRRNVDPVLKSMRNIQLGAVSAKQPAPEGSTTTTTSSGLAAEVSVTLADVMSLMELLSRSVMLVSMHNLDPNSLKLVYLSSSYIRSLKRLAKGRHPVESAPTGVDEAAGDAEDADRVSRLEM